MGFGSSLKKAAKKVGRGAKRGVRAYNKAGRRAVKAAGRGVKASVKAQWKFYTAPAHLASKASRGVLADPWTVEGRQELGVQTASVATAALTGGVSAAALAGAKIVAAKGLSLALGGSASDSVGYDATPPSSGARASSFGARASPPATSSGNGWGTGGALALFAVVGLAFWKGATG